MKVSQKAREELYYRKLERSRDRLIKVLRVWIFGILGVCFLWVIFGVVLLEAPTFAGFVFMPVCISLLVMYRKRRKIKEEIEKIEKRMIEFERVS